jgi:hypothetical protein
VAELRNIRWGKFIKALLEQPSRDALIKSRSLQWALTVAFRKNSYMLVDDLEDLVMEYKGVKFYPDLLNYPRMFEAWDRYNINGIKIDDTILDVGANIGSFTLPAAQRCKKVIAVEPIFPRGLRNNSVLNNLESKIEVLEYAIGDTTRKKVEVDCQEYKGFFIPISPLDLYEMGSFDVIRLDCGGWEKTFSPEEFQPRQWEVEFHDWGGEKGAQTWTSWKPILEEQGFGYKARWSKHKHWIYLSASKDYNFREEIQLKNGDMRTKEASVQYLSSRS